VVREVGIDYCWKETQNDMATINDKISTLACSNHRVCMSTKVTFSVLAVSSNVSRCFLLDRIRIKPFFKRTSIHRVPSTVQDSGNTAKFLYHFFVVVGGKL